MFSIIGDIHGCSDELSQLLAATAAKSPRDTLVFLGDFIDRGPDNVGVLKTVMHLVNEGLALAVIGNHDDKLRRYLKGNPIKLNRELSATLSELESEGSDFLSKVYTFLEGLPWRLKLDNGNLICVHGAAPAHLQNKNNRAARSAALYGVTGQPPRDKLPTRLNWAKDYKGKPIVVHGHVAVKEPVVQNGVYDIDTACVYGGKLTALHYPSMQFTSVKANRVYKADSLIV